MVGVGSCELLEEGVGGKRGRATLRLRSKQKALTRRGCLLMKRLIVGRYTTKKKAFDSYFQY